MGGSMNKVFLIGRIAKDIEVKYTPTQVAMTNVVIAIDRTVKGEKKTDFPRVAVFGKDAENLEKFSGKGLRIAVEGRLETGSYKKGEDTIYTTNIVSEHVEVLEFRPKEAPVDFSKIDGDISF